MGTILYQVFEKKNIPFHCSVNYLSDLELLLTFEDEGLDCMSFNRWYSSCAAAKKLGVFLQQRVKLCVWLNSLGKLQRGPTN